MPHAEQHAPPEPASAPAAPPPDILLEAILASSDDAILSEDLAGTILSWSAGAERLYGYRAEEAVGRPASMLVPPGGEDEGQRILARVARGEVVARHETRRRRRDGALVDVELTVFPLRDPAGRIAGASSLARDVTGRRRLEASLRARERRQAALSELGAGALGTKDPVALFQRAVRRVAEVLDVPFAKVLELRPDGRLLLRAGVGWRKGLVGRASVGGDLDSQAGYTLRSRGPVVVADLAAERRFRGSSLLVEHGVVSSMGVVIEGRPGPYGVLGVHTREHREFSEDDVHFLESVAVLLATALWRSGAEAEVERLLRLSEERAARLDAALESMPDAVCFGDAAGIKAVNGRGLALLGFATVAEASRSNEELVRALRPRHADSGRPIPEEEMPFLRSLRGERCAVDMVLRNRRTGQDVVVRWATAPVLEGGAVTGVVAVLTDVGERRRAEQRLREAEERWRTLLVSVPDQVLHLDREGRILFLNAAPGRGGGVGAVGRGFLEGVHADDRAAAQAALEQVVRTGRAGEAELRMATWAGMRVHRVSVGPVRGEGEVEELVVVCTDLTEARRAERERVEAEQRLEEVERFAALDRAKARFLNTAAHELRTPLTPMKVQLHLLRQAGERGWSGEQRRSLEVLERSLDRMAALVEDLLSGARIEAGQMQLSRQPLELATFLQRAVVAVAGEAAEAGVALETSLAGGLVVEADPTRLRQVVQHVLRNAVRFTPRGGRVRVASRPHPEGAEVRVEDSGIGLRPDHVPGLFRPFGLAQDPAGARGQGTGLGLYISRGIVEQHGGRLWCESPGPGLGATFAFTLPTAPALPGPGARGP